MSTLRLIRLVERAHDRLLDRGAEETLPRVRGLTRRELLAYGATALAGSLLAACNARGPEGAAGFLRSAEQRNETVERWLVRHTRIDGSAAGIASAGDRFPSYFISDTVPVWDDAVRGAWALEVGGLVRTPLRLTLDDLRRLGSVTEKHNHFCVEGWNAVARFTGTPLRAIARAAGVQPTAGYVDFASFDDGYHESWDLTSALHPQTLVVFAKDGAMLPPAYGAPARVHSPIKLGYKNTKYLTRITFLPSRNGGYWSDQGYEWFGGT